MRRAACTIVSINYLPYARTFYESFREQHPDYEVFVLIVDRPPLHLNLSVEPFTVVYVEDLNIPSFKTVAFQYDILELNTNVKPTFLKSILSRGIEELIYFDPDIYVRSSVDFVYDLLAIYNVILTPHAVTPPEDRGHALEQELLVHGTFNLGFIAVSDSSEAKRFLDWWEERCLNLGFADLRNGLFVDQKWVNFAPVWFEGVHILKHLGCNMAHWNLHERQLTRGNGDVWVNGSVPLIFYHCSGVKARDEGMVSQKGQSRLTTEMRQDLADLLAQYRSRLVANGSDEYQTLDYFFGRFSGGQRISSLARRVYSLKKAEFGGGDPFDSDSTFYAYAKRHRLIGTADRSAKFNSLNYNRSDWRIRLINRILKACLAWVGADRYTMLMKYLSFISILRNQSELFK